MYICVTFSTSFSSHTNFVLKKSKTANTKTFIATFFTFLRVSSIIIQSSVLSLNPDKFSFCTVYLIRNPVAKSSLGVSNQVTEERNEMLNAIQLENYQALTNIIFFNLVISDTTDPGDRLEKNIPSFLICSDWSSNERCQ